MGFIIGALPTTDLLQGGSERGPASPASEGDEEQEDQEWARLIAIISTIMPELFFFRFQRGVNKREKALSGRSEILNYLKLRYDVLLSCLQ